MQNQKESQKKIKALLFVVVFSMGFNLKILFDDSRDKEELELAKEAIVSLIGENYELQTRSNFATRQLKECVDLLP